jgi:hypothetical protein
MNLSDMFGIEYNKISEEIKTTIDNMHEIQQHIITTPPLTDLTICKTLENEYKYLTDYTFLLSTLYMKMSQLYHYTRLVNESIVNKKDEE